MSDNVMKFQPYSARKFQESKYWNKLNESQQHDFLIGTEILPFRVNEFVLQNLLNWDNLDNDPIYNLLFPQKSMLENNHYEQIEGLLKGDRSTLSKQIKIMRESLNPHPSSQAANVPYHKGEYLKGIQHKYPETLLFFPSAGQSCHSYCTFCFRWAQFVGDMDDRFQSKDIDQLVDYINCHPEITDVLITGGDSMIIKTRVLERYINALLDKTNITTIRFGSKALTYWPYRFTQDDDADDLIRLFEKIVSRGRHLSFMAHFNHSCELEPVETAKAIKRILSTGAVIRTQSPILKNINDNADVWASMWRKQTQLGCIPYYMFVERDTGPKKYFELPLYMCHEIFKNAYSQVSGLARTVRGPVMSASLGKVLIDGVIELGSEKYFVLEYLQSRIPSSCRQPFLAKLNTKATWFDNLELHPEHIAYGVSLLENKKCHSHTKRIEVVNSF